MLCISDYNHLLSPPPFSFSLSLPSSGLSHLMMSEQGRCCDPADAWTACLCASGCSFRASSIEGHLLLVPPAVGPTGSRGHSAVAEEHLSWRIVVSHLLLPASPFLPTICHLGQTGSGPAGLLLRGKHETRHDTLIMGVNEANFRATRRLTSSCSS